MYALNPSSGYSYLHQFPTCAPPIEVYEEMPSPNLAAYNAVIDVCARCGDADKAAAVFKSMMLRSF